MGFFSRARQSPGDWLLSSGSAFLSAGRWPFFWKGASFAPTLASWRFFSTFFNWVPSYPWRAGRMRSPLLATHGHGVFLAARVFSHSMDFTGYSQVSASSFLFVTCYSGKAILLFSRTSLPPRSVFLPLKNAGNLFPSVQRLCLIFFSARDVRRWAPPFS